MTRPAPRGRSIYRTPEGREEIRRWCESAMGSWALPHRTRTLDTALGPTHVVSAGAGADVLLLPGTNFCAATSEELIAALAPHHTVHAVDLPGQPGLSSPIRDAGARTREGAWLSQVLSALEAPDAVVVGHSLGAAVALRAAAQGAGVRRLVLVDPAGVTRLRVSPAVLRPTLPWVRRPGRSTAAALLRMMMAPGAAPAEHLVGWMALVGRHVRTSLAPAPLPARQLQALADVAVDIVSGRHDAFLPPRPLAAGARRRLPEAELTVVEHAGHLLPYERPEAVAALLRDRGPTGAPPSREGARRLHPPSGRLAGD